MKSIPALLLSAVLFAASAAPVGAESEAPTPVEDAAAPPAAEPAAPLPGPVSKQLSAAELERVKKGEIILRSSTDEATTSGSGYAIGYIHADVAKIWETILDFDRYAEYQPRVTYCKRTLYAGNKIDADFRLDMDVTEIKYTINHIFHADRNRLTWTLDKSKPADYLTETVGYFQLEQLPGGGSLIEYSVSVDLEINVPGVGWIVRKLAKYLTGTDLPNVIERLRKRIESGNAWKRE